MISLKSILEASILADIDDQLESGDEALKSAVESFIKDNYNYKFIEISDKMNDDGKFVVNGFGNIEFNGKGTSLTNGMFVWGYAEKQFVCEYCDDLESLEGAPSFVGGIFSCAGNDKLKDLKGAPKEIEGSFYCNECPSLVSLEGGPEYVNGDFNCDDCYSLVSLKLGPKQIHGAFNCNSCEKLKSLKGAPNYMPSGSFLCANCTSLKSLDGAPKKVINFVCDGCKKLKYLKGAPIEVGKNFYCIDCGMKFTEDDVKKVSNVKGKIYC